MSNLDSKNKLTEFPALEADEKEDGRFSFSKLWWWKKADASSSSKLQDGDSASLMSEISDTFQTTGSAARGLTSANSASANDLRNQAPTSLEDGHRSMTFPSPDAKRAKGRHLSVSTNLKIHHLHRSDSSLSNRSNTSPEIMEGSVSPFETRTLPNVLRRISNLIAMGSHNQSDIKKYWMPDSVSKECYDCAEKFTTFRRKHHCRICGQIFCSRCCNQEIPGKIIGYSGELRVCTYCCKIVLSYLNSADLSTDTGDELKLVQEDLQNRFGGTSSDTLSSSSIHPYGSSSSTDHLSSYRSLPRRKASVVYQEERFIGSRTQDSSFDVVEEKLQPLEDWASLKALWDEMCHPVTGIDWSTHRHNMMKNFTNCGVGSELVDWLLAHRKITWRGQGVQIGQMLLDVSLIECVSQVEQVFLDAYALYRPMTLPLPPVLEEIPEVSSNRSSADFGSGQDPLWMKQIRNSQKIPEVDEADDESLETRVSEDQSPDSLKPRLPSAASLYSLDLNMSESTVSISKPRDRDFYSNSPTGSTPRSPRKPAGAMSSITTETMTDEFLQNTIQSQKDRLSMSNENELIPPSGWHAPQQLTSDIEVQAFQYLCNAYIRHENDFLMQLLEKEHLSPSWADIILPIVHKVTEIVRPDVRNAGDDMDIRQYIQFKKVPGGRKEDCRIVNGVVCSKNVAHRGMRKKLKAPKILLIGSSIDYQRFENRFLSLEPLVMQENEYLKNTVLRIASLSPDLLLVERTVSRLAQEFLLEKGITLVLNVKASVMERIARSTQGVIESSADSPIGRPQLGLCHNFYLESFTLSTGLKKTLMFFDGCAMHLGCTVLLRGGSGAELVKVKKVMALFMYVAYNWRLERSFHIDLFAMPPDDREKSREAAREESPDSLFTTGPKIHSQSTEQLPPQTPENKLPVKSEVCDDYSDPLHSYLVTGTPQQSEELPLVVSNVPDPASSTAVNKCSFKKCLEEVILSASPFIRYSLPYLETEPGKTCKLRAYFPEEIYWSPLLYSNAEVTEEETIPDPAPPIIDWKEPHDFVNNKFTSPVDSDEVQGLIADFRRKGHRLGFDSHAHRVSRISHKSIEPDVRSEVSSYVSPELNFAGRVDALDPFKHQSLSVLFCSFSSTSSNAPNFCVPPWVVNMDMYGRNDISLGMFLERYCFRKSYMCPSKTCGTSMINSHLRRFVHEHGCIMVSLKELEKPIPGAAENILMWNWCAQCKTVTPIVPMSVDAWSLSFAKYLELRFHGQRYNRRNYENEEQCPHSLHHDHIQYFTQNSVVASFKYSSIKIWEICLPVAMISVKKEPKPVPDLIEEVKTVAITGHGVYTNILEVLLSVKENSVGLRVEEVVKALLEHLKVEQSVFRSRIEDIQLNLTSPSLKAGQDSQGESFLWKVTDSIGFLKSFISDTIQGWNSRLHDVFLLRKKEERNAKTGSRVENETDGAKAIQRTGSDSGLLGQSTSVAAAVSRESDDSQKSDLPIEARLDLSSDARSRDRLSLTSGSTVDMSVSGVLEELSNTPVPSLANILLVTPSDELIDFSSTAATCPPSPSQSIHSDNHSTPQNEIRSIQKLEKGVSIRSSGELAGFLSEDGPDSKFEKKSTSSAMKNIISHFMSSTSGQVIQSPWLPIEHHFQAALTTIPVPVFENEPSSVVAFALSSNEYKTKRADLLRDKSMQNSSKIPEDESQTAGKKPKLTTTDAGAEYEFLGSYGSFGGSAASETSGEALVDAAVEAGNGKDGLGKSHQHIEVQFSSNAAKFYCRVYFAEKFRQLRKTCICEGEEFYIRSISRCISWAATGGKSGSTFCKTFDDRFVVKQMSKFEIQSFLDFAPNYFNYMKTCYQDKKPTVLAKIVGVYRIGLKNSQNNSGSKLDILIMENLFYQRKISQKFDLKGSIRNRLATKSGKEQEELVLLDENLVNMACENPLYIRPHTKTVLTMSVSNDSRFLSSQMVMDYSLLVGLDEESNELVVGIIDYIRTFTWDKKIETFVKSSGFLGGQGKTPTVVSPEEYQARFCEAMNRYFLLVPDRWMGLGLGVDS